MARQALAFGLTEEMAGQSADILAPVAQGRQFDRHDIEAIKQILPERARRDHRRERAVGGSDDPHIDRDLVPPTDPPDTSRLQGAQQPGLRLCGHVADLVEKQRAAIRLFELSDRLRNRSGEGAPFVAEQFAFDEVVRDRRHVDCHERAGPPRAQLMDRFGHQLLARARFTGHQHGEVVAQDLGDHAIDALHRLAATDKG